MKIAVFEQERLNFVIAHKYAIRKGLWCKWRSIKRINITNWKNEGEDAC